MYNGEGRWDFIVNAFTGSCAMPTAGRRRCSGSLDIAPGTTTSGRGPAQPTVRIDTYHGTGRAEAPNKLLLFAAHDDDGYITRFTIDWGNATNGERGGDGMGCRPSRTGWPLPSDAWIPFSDNPVPPTHQYASPGTYRVTVNSYSAGCDGSTVQKVSAL